MSCNRDDLGPKSSSCVNLPSCSFTPALSQRLSLPAGVGSPLDWGNPTLEERGAHCSMPWPRGAGRQPHFPAISISFHINPPGCIPVPKMTPNQG